MKDQLKYFLEKMYEVSKIPKSFMNKESNSDSDRKLSKLADGFGECFREFADSLNNILNR